MLSMKVDGKQFATWHAGEILFPLIPKDAISVEVYADEQEVTRLLAWLVQMDERGYNLSVSAKIL